MYTEILIIRIGLRYAFLSIVFGFWNRFLASSIATKLSLIYRVELEHLIKGRKI